MEGKYFYDYERKFRESMFKKADWNYIDLAALDSSFIQETLVQRKKVSKANKNSKTDNAVGRNGEFVVYNYERPAEKDHSNSIGMESLGSYDENDVEYTYILRNRNLYEFLPMGTAFQSCHWVADVKWSNQRISLENVKIKEPMGNHDHLHNVFSSLSFKNVVIEFEVDGVYFSFDLDDTTACPPVGVGYNAGCNGAFEGVENFFQLGISEFNYYRFYCYDTVIDLTVIYSFVFGYPGNDFEPSGLIDACKIFPQISFEYEKKNYKDAWIHLASDPRNIHVDLPLGTNGNRIKVKRIYARTKLTCNNNSSHHTTEVDSNGFDQGYFSAMRNGGHLPLMFEKLFDQDKKYHNFVGFFTDSNTGQIKSAGNRDRVTDNGEDRDKPGFEILAANISAAGYNFSALSQPAPFWNNIFDYGSYNHADPFEFHAVNKKGTRGKVAYPTPYPIGSDKYLKIEKVKRQGAYDNIHFHGYFGHYLDNGQPVVHAPICGYCCFHMHWRWSGLNHEILNSIPIAIGSQDFKDAFRRFFVFKTRHLGWGKGNDYIADETPNTVAGAPLIPSDQELHIAVTNNDVNPPSTGPIVSSGPHVPLDGAEKTIWYSIVIDNEYADRGMHISMEQGCGYAFRYSEFGKNTKELKTLDIDLVTSIPSILSWEKSSFPKSYREILENPDNALMPEQTNPDLPYISSEFLDYVYNLTTDSTSLQVHEFYEMQYRFMRFFNEHKGHYLRKYTNQVPIINYGFEGDNTEDPNILYNYGAMLNTLRDY